MRDDDKFWAVLARRLKAANASRFNEVTRDLALLVGAEEDLAAVVGRLQGRATELQRSTARARRRAGAR